MDAKNRNVTPKASPEPRRRPPAAGKGRPRGAKNKKSQAQKLAEARERTLKLELEGDVSEFFQKLTVKSYTWRENMRRKMEDPKHGTDPRMVDQCLEVRSRDAQEAAAGRDGQ